MAGQAMHVRVWSLRRWRHECRSCQLPWRGKFERCPGQPFEEAYPHSAPIGGWNAPTLRFGVPIILVQNGPPNGGKW